MNIDNNLMRMLNPAKYVLGGLILLLTVFPAMADDGSLQEEQQAYNVQLKKYQQSENERESIVTDIKASEAKLKELKKEKNSSQTALEDIQRIDRQNPDLGLANNVHDARVRNQTAYKNYQAEKNRLQSLRLKKIQLDNDVQNNIISLNNIARSIKQKRDSIVNEEVDKRIAKFKKTTEVEGYSEVGCGDESTSKCQARAKKAAERDASEKGSVMLVNSVTNIKNFQLTQDQIKTEVQAQLSNEKVLDKGWVSDTTYKFHIRASVTPVISASLRNQIKDSITQELGIVVPEEVSFENGSLIAANPSVTTSSSGAKSNAEKSFEEMDRETGHTKTDIEREEEAQRQRFAKQPTEKTTTKTSEVVRPASETESWYTLWGLGGASNTYPSGAQSAIDIFLSEHRDELKNIQSDNELFRKMSDADLWIVRNELDNATTYLIENSGRLGGTIASIDEYFSELKTRATSWKDEKN